LAAGYAEAGTLVAEADLAEFQAEIQPPLAIDYRGLTVLEAPPNSTGFVLLQELKIVEHFDLKSMGLGSADLVHVLVEAKKLAFADRERWGADPRTLEEVHGDPPFAELLSADYAARLAARIDRRRAAPIRAIADAAGDTTYFCTADGEGNAVSGIQSINSGWGSGVTAGDTARRGHPVDTVGDLDGPCSVEVIRRLPDGTLLAGSDPRRDGWALAW